MRPQRENTWGGFCHLFNVLPVWGLIFCGVLWFALHEESKRVVDHARQALRFHSLLLIALVGWLLVGLLARLLSMLFPTLAVLLGIANNSIMTLLYAGYLFICLFGALRTMAGSSFAYPIVNARVE